MRKFTFLSMCLALLFLPMNMISQENVPVTVTPEFLVMGFSNLEKPLSSLENEIIVFEDGIINSHYQSSPLITVTTTSLCPGVLTIVVPTGKRIASLSSEYQMTSAGAGNYGNVLMGDQRSYIYSPSLNKGEADVAYGSGQEGTKDYNRNLEFATGATGSVSFELRAFRAYAGSGCNSDYVYVPNNSWKLKVAFEDIPSCPEVDDLQITPLMTGDQSTTASWIDVGLNTIGYEYELRTSGQPGSGAEGFVSMGLINDPNQTSFLIENLETPLNYYFYIRALCESDDKSPWKSSASFALKNCVPTYSSPSFSNRITKVEILETNFVDTIPSNTDRDRTAVVVPTMESGATYSFRISTIGWVGAGVAIDFNKNGIFEENEIFGYTDEGTEGPGNGGIVVTIPGAVPAGIANGTYLMRVWNWGSNSGGGDNTPCGSYGYGTWADYNIVVEGEIDPCIDIASPEAASPQAMIEGQTIADIVVEGENLEWYTDEDLTEVVEEDFVLTEGEHTFYVTQTIGTCTSLPTAVTVTITLGVNDLDLASLKYWPNPVDSELTVSYKEPIRSVEIYDILGKQIKVQKFETNEVRLDVSRLSAGTYMLKVQTDTGSQFVKIVKK